MTWLTVTNWVPPVNDLEGRYPVTEEGVTRGHLGTGYGVEEGSFEADRFRACDGRFPTRRFEDSQGLIGGILAKSMNPGPIPYHGLSPCLLPRKR